MCIRSVCRQKSMVAHLVVLRPGLRRQTAGDDEEVEESFALQFSRVPTEHFRQTVCVLGCLYILMFIYCDRTYCLNAGCALGTLDIIFTRYVPLRIRNSCFLILYMHACAQTPGQTSLICCVCLWCCFLKAICILRDTHPPPFPLFMDTKRVQLDLHIMQHQGVHLEASKSAWNEKACRLEGRDEGWAEENAHKWSMKMKRRHEKFYCRFSKEVQSWMLWGWDQRGSL